MKKSGVCVTREKLLHEFSTLLLAHTSVKKKTPAAKRRGGPASNRACLWLRSMSGALFQHHCENRFFTFSRQSSLPESHRFSFVLPFVGWTAVKWTRPRWKNIEQCKFCRFYWTKQSKKNTKKASRVQFDNRTQTVANATTKQLIDFPNARMLCNALSICIMRDYFWLVFSAGLRKTQNPSTMVFWFQANTSRLRMTKSTSKRRFNGRMSLLMLSSISARWLAFIISSPVNRCSRLISGVRADRPPLHFQCQTKLLIFPLFVSTQSLLSPCCATSRSASACIDSGRIAASRLSGSLSCCCCSSTQWLVR